MCDYAARASYRRQRGRVAVTRRWRARSENSVWNRVYPLLARGMLTSCFVFVRHWITGSRTTSNLLSPAGTGVERHKFKVLKFQQMLTSAMQGAGSSYPVNSVGTVLRSAHTRTNYQNTLYGVRTGMMISVGLRCVYGSCSFCSAAVKLVQRLAGRDRSRNRMGLSRQTCSSPSENADGNVEQQHRRRLPGLKSQSIT